MRPTHYLLPSANHHQTTGGGDGVDREQGGNQAQPNRISDSFNTKMEPSPAHSSRTRQKPTNETSGSQLHRNQVKTDSFHRTIITGRRSSVRASVRAGWWDEMVQTEPRCGFVCCSWFFLFCPVHVQQISGKKGTILLGTWTTYVPSLV